MAPQEPSQARPPSNSSASATLVTTPSSVPPPVPVETHPNRGQFRPTSRSSNDSNKLATEDGFKYQSPPRLRPLHEITGITDPAAASAAAAALRPAIASLRAPPAIPPVAAKLEQERRQRNTSRKRRQQPHVWKKLLWIKQHGFPDNYTDSATFLDHLQRNPRLRPYELWPLVADSTVIVQHVCSVAVFISAYAGIYQERLSPVTVVTCGAIATLIGWIMWDFWMGEEEAESQTALEAALAETDADTSLNNLSSVNSSIPTNIGNIPPSRYMNGHVNSNIRSRGLALTLSTSNLSKRTSEPNLVGIKHSQSFSKSSINSMSSNDGLHEPFPDFNDTLSPPPPRKSVPSIPSHVKKQPASTEPPFSQRNQVRLKTLKSALLIYFTLLGLSPILKSLTKSTSSDSIWALATWLIMLNIFFFDYGSVYVPEDKTKVAATTKPSTSSSPVHEKQQARLRSMSVATPLGATPGSLKASSAPPFPSSLSTNAALMASTVLASRLPTTTSVFSLSLFSIQVFGLFPVFRRHLKYKSPDSLHILLTCLLIVMASCGLVLVLSQSYTHTYGDCGYCWGWLWHVLVRCVAGTIVGSVSVVFVMGACSWWLISLQRYKNVVTGPWDPARPLLAGGVSVLSRARSGAD